MTLAIRLALTLALLAIVAQHAHWSVALALFLLFVNSELLALIQRWQRLRR